MNDKQVLQDVAFNPAAKCSPTATQCPRCNNPHNACDKARAWHFNAVAISEALIAAAGKE